MLPIPSQGFAWSVDAHNTDLPTVCDWIEGSVLFADDELSLSDVTDVLVEEEVYAEQDMARQRVDDCWAELEQRIRYSGTACGYEAVGEKRFAVRNEWRHSPAFSFCVLLSLAPKYSWWHVEFGQDYTDQGDLFERLTVCSLQAQFPGWEIQRTGWARKHAVDLATLASAVATRLRGEVGDVALWEGGKAKDLGADILGLRPFIDNAPGIPAYLVQCASGGNWHSKRGQPDLKEWGSLIRVATPPGKAFAIPFILDEGEFRRCCIGVGGMLLDRNRLLMASHHVPNWVPEDLARDLLAWCCPRVEGVLRRGR